MRYKAKDIAKELGVSPATVSLVLNNRPGVGEEKREEIMKKVMEMGCEYLLKEGNMKKGEVGFIIYKCGGTIIDEYPIFNYLSESITGTLGKNGYTMTMMYLDKNMPLSERYLVLESARRVGYIVYAVEMYPEDAEIFQKLKVPCVFLDNPFPTVGIDSVSVDNYLGVYRAFEYLYEMGHREIGYIRSKFPIICFEERIQAYYDGMRRHNLGYNADYIMEVGYLEENTKQDVKGYLESRKKLPTAFLADNDLLACRAVQVFKLEGLRVPEDISVMGFDNRAICSFTEPKVSTIQLPGDQMGQMAVEMLIKRMQNPNACPVKCKIGPEIVVNESVARIL